MFYKIFRKNLLIKSLILLSIGVGLHFSQNFSGISQWFYSNESVNELAPKYGSAYNAFAVSDLDIKVDVSQAQMSANDYKSSLNNCIDTVSSALRLLPSRHLESLKKLTLRFDPTARRGLAGGQQMLVRCTDVSNDELMAVVVHEMGHVVDTGSFLSGSSKSSSASNYKDGSVEILSDDPSVNYYSISFRSNDEVKDADLRNFVSGYAMSDPFEDFAETYIYYVLHGDAFRKLSKTNQTLQLKYKFMRDIVFEGLEYKGLQEFPRIDTRNYDATLIDYEKEEIFTL